MSCHSLLNVNVFPGALRTHLNLIRGNRIANVCMPQNANFHFNLCEYETTIGKDERPDIDK